MASGVHSICHMNRQNYFSVRHLFSVALWSFLAIGVVMSGGCNQGSSRSTLGDDKTKEDVFKDFNDLGNNGKGKSLGDIGAGGGVAQPKPGSNSDGSFSGLDKQAVNNAYSENQQVAPTGKIEIFTDELKAQAKEILALQRQKKDTAVKKLLFMAAMLKRCGEVVAKFTPIAGQPLMGKWNGQGACSVSFDVAGNGAGGKYAVTGGSKGTLTADTQGKGAIQADPFSGNVVDSPQSGTGQVVYPGFFKTKAGTSDCVLGIRLAEPTSPIPANYKEGMTVMGACLRNTALFISPVFDRMFQDMNPAVSEQLQKKFLNIE